MLSRLSSSLRLGAVATTTISTLAASFSAELASATSAVSTTEVSTATAAVVSAGLGLLAGLNDKSVFVLAGGTVMASASAVLATAATITTTTAVVTATATAVATFLLLAKLGAGLVGDDDSLLALLDDNGSFSGNGDGGCGSGLSLLLGGSSGSGFWNLLGSGSIAVKDIEVVAKVEGAIADHLVSVIGFEFLLVVLGLDEGVEGEEGDAAFADRVVAEFGQLDEVGGRSLAQELNGFGLTGGPLLAHLNLVQLRDDLQRSGQHLLRVSLLTLSLLLLLSLLLQLCGVVVFGFEVKVAEFLELLDFGLKCGLTLEHLLLGIGGLDFALFDALFGLDDLVQFFLLVAESLALVVQEKVVDGAEVDLKLTFFDVLVVSRVGLVLDTHLLITASL